MPEGRNNKGQFLKGSPGINHRKPGDNPGGRPKTVKGLTRDALALAEDAMPKIIQGMIRDALDEKIPANVRQQCREFLVERIYGKANQPIKLDNKEAILTFVFHLADGSTTTARNLLNPGGDGT